MRREKWLGQEIKDDTAARSGGGNWKHGGIDRQIDASGRSQATCVYYYRLYTNIYWFYYCCHYYYNTVCVHSIVLHSIRRVLYCKVTRAASRWEMHYLNFGRRDRRDGAKWTAVSTHVSKRNNETREFSNLYATGDFLRGFGLLTYRNIVVACCSDPWNLGSSSKGKQHKTTYNKKRYKKH